MWWTVLAWAGPEVEGTLPAPDAAAVWVELEPDSPWTRLWLDALLGAPGRTVPVIAVSRAPLSSWDRFDGRPGWDTLVVVSDPDGTTQQERIPRDQALGTTALWSEGKLLRGWLPVRVDDERARATLAWVVDPSAKPPRVKGYPSALLSLAAYSSESPRLTRRVARYVRRSDDPWSARLAVDIADQLLHLDDVTAKDGELAAEMLEQAMAFLPGDPYVDGLLDRARRAVLGDPTPPATHPPPATLTGEELAHDVEVLTTWIRERYSGYEDDDDALPGGWAAHEQAALAAARATDTWTFEEAFRWLADVALSPIDDPHVSLRVDGDPVPARWLGRSPTLLYTDLRLDADGRVVEGPEGWVGRRLELPPVPADPRAAESGVTYAFPTLAADGTDRWLVGTFDLGGHQTLQLEGEELPLHPPRIVWDGPDEAWSVHDEVLAVRNMDPAQQQGMPATAASLRALPRVLVDLRGNEGGSDQPALDWVKGFSGGRYASEGVSYKRTHGWIGVGAWPFVVDETPVYEGQLQILVDGNVCSSGETFVFLATQVPGARLVGANTSGCLGNGNVSWLGTLPHTQIDLYAGITNHGDLVRPGRESWGVFPDIWLDEPDPVTFLRGLP